MSISTSDRAFTLTPQRPPVSQTVSQTVCGTISQTFSQTVSQTVCGTVSETVCGTVSETVCGTVSQTVCDPAVHRAAAALMKTTLRPSGDNAGCMQLTPLHALTLRGAAVPARTKTSLHSWLRDTPRRRSVRV